MDRKSTITERTLIPISLVLAIGGGIIWLTTLYNSSIANAAELRKIKNEMLIDRQMIMEKNDAVLNTLKEINTRLSRIEGKLSR